jgi:hypothetical protein
MKFPKRLGGWLLPVLLAAAPLTLKAQTNAPAPNRVRPARAPGVIQGSSAAGFALGGPVGALTDQQRASYETALNNIRGEMNELQAKLRAARQDFLLTSLDQKFDENLLRQKALVASRFEAELAVLRAKALSQIQPPLSPEQIQRIKSGQPGPVQPLRRQQFERPALHAPTASTNQDATGLPPKK